jgi:hypothetical protein
MILGSMSPSFGNRIRLFVMALIPSCRDLHGVDVRTVARRVVTHDAACDDRGVG